MVDNLAFDLQAFLSHVFLESDAGVGLVVNQIAGFIDQMLQSENPSQKNLKVYASFLNKATKEDFPGTDVGKIEQTIVQVNDLLYLNNMRVKSIPSIFLVVLSGSAFSTNPHALPAPF